MIRHDSKKRVSVSLPMELYEQIKTLSEETERTTSLSQIILSLCCCSIWKQMLPVPNSRKRTLPALVSVSGASGKTNPPSTSEPDLRT